MSTVILLGRAQMGEGDAELGRKILGTFFKKSIVIPDLETIALYNSGVQLATRESPVAIELQQLHDRGVDVLACRTCVEHYNLADRLLFNPPSTMDDILTALRHATKVISL